MSQDRRTREELAQDAVIEMTDSVALIGAKLADLERSFSQKNDPTSRERILDLARLLFVSRCSTEMAPQVIRARADDCLKAADIFERAADDYEVAS